GRGPRGLRAAGGGKARQPRVVPARQARGPPGELPAAAAAEGTLEPVAPPQLADAPAVSAKEIAELTRAALGHDAIEALAIDVDDPQQVAESSERLLRQRLPDIALVQLGIAHHRDEALRSARA